MPTLLRIAAAAGTRSRLRVCPTHLLRRPIEYPELKRELHAQYERLRPSLVLIENKASGTQLIRELIAEGLHAVIRYLPQADKVMRMHAQIDRERLCACARHGAVAGAISARALPQWPSRRPG
jgi:hypothetical protein